MATTFPYFGELPAGILEESYEVEIPFEGHPVQIDLNFENPNPSLQNLHLIAHHLKNLAGLHRLNLMEIENDFKASGEVDYYLTEHLERLEQADLEKILVKADKSKPPKEQMLQSLFLNRIGFYPEVENAGIVFDYTVSTDCIDDLIVVFRNLDGAFDGIVIES